MIKALDVTGAAVSTHSQVFSSAMAVFSKMSGRSPAPLLLAGACFAAQSFVAPTAPGAAPSRVPTAAAQPAAPGFQGLGATPVALGATAAVAGARKVQRARQRKAKGNQLLEFVSSVQEHHQTRFQ